MTRRHPSSIVKQSGSNLSPCGVCLPQALLVYWEVWDTPEAGPRSGEGLGTGVTLQTLLCNFILVAYHMVCEPAQLSPPPLLVPGPSSNRHGDTSSSNLGG